METAVEFGLLGPLEVRTGGESVPIAPGKQRALLAALLLNANQMVSGTKLTDVLWGDDSPPSARATLQNYVKRLRQGIQTTGHARIRTLSGGYLICAEPDELDVLRFEGLQERARRAAQGGAWDQAAQQLRAALSLWRGDPLADVQSDWLAMREVPRLIELRRQAVEARIEADLQLGRHAAVIGELRQLTFANPLRERLHGLLMLALYRDGQQAEALGSYQHARRVLIKELGAEPGQELSNLERRILAADPALQPPAPAATIGHTRAGSAPQVTPVIPRQLPAPVRHFCGRSAELGALTSMTGSPGNAGRTVVITAIAGTAGVGKTALALQWAHQAASQFPDGQLYLNLRSYDPGEPMTAADALAALLRAIGVQGQEIPPEAEERAAKYRSLLAGRHMLVLLDNVGSAEQVRLLLPGTPGCAALITSRDALSALVARDGAQRLDLDLLPMADAMALLRALIGGRADADAAALEELAALCARLPLALRVAAELVAARPAAPLTELVTELADQQQRLDLLDAGGDSRTAIRTVFSWSGRNLSPATARMFSLLGLHPGADFDAYAAAALFGASIRKARQLLAALARAYLIQPAGRDRYQMHDLLKAYAAELANDRETEPDRRAALTGLFDYYLTTAAGAVDAVYSAGNGDRTDVPPPVSPAPAVNDPASARRWLDAHLAMLTAVAEYTADNGWPAYTSRLATAVFRYLERGAHYAETVAMCTHARRAAGVTGDLAAEAEAVNNATVVDLRQGRYEQAADRLRAALILYQRVGDQIGQARARGNLGIVCTQLGQYRDASKHHGQALELYQQAGDLVGAARTLNNLGLVDLRQGRYQQAAARFQHSLAMNPGARSESSVASALAMTNLGICELRLGHYSEASDQLRDALAQFRELGFATNEALVLTSLGAVHRRQGDFGQAVGLQQQALTLTRQLGDTIGEAEARNGLGETLLAAGERDRAREHLAAAFSVASSTGDKYEQTRALNLLGELHLANDNVSLAREHLEAALSLALGIGEQYEQARALEHLAHAHYAANDLDHASRCWQQALALYSAVGVPEASQVRAQLAAASASIT